VVVIDSLYFGQAILRMPYWCYKSPLFHEVLQSTPNSLAVHNFFHFPLHFAFNNDHKQQQDDLSWDQFVDGSVK